MPSTIKVLFLAAEAEPFIKVGGLADVAGSLPLALRCLSPSDAGGAVLDVRLVLPLYQNIHIGTEALPPVMTFPVFRRGGDLKAQVYKTALNGMPVYFIAGNPISASDSVYSTDPAADREKFAFFSLAALELARRLDWQPDILHANDWHTSMALYALRSRRTGHDKQPLHSVLTVHNLPYMGGDGTDVLSAYGLAPLEEASFPPWACSQPLPLGLWSADALVPVSPTYASEILTPAFGCGLETFLQSRAGAITGILNGLDTATWDPAKDEALAANFTAEELSARATNKAALQKQLGLEPDPCIPLLASIGRMDHQKGLDITLTALPQLGDRPWQFVLLGTGDPALEDQARQLQAKHPDRVRAAVRFDAPLGHLIYAGADLFLMPSRYEPCGLAQMIAMRYGCLPLGRATGGLKDTIREGETGFLFQEPNAASMLEALERALSTYAHQKEWKKLQRSAMGKDFSWPRSARQYAMIYHSLLSQQRHEKSVATIPNSKI